MLSEMLKSSLVTMNLRVIDHAALLATQVSACVAVMERDREICHICGISVPGFMEIDHLNGHRKSSEKDLRCICQFCHNLKHPIWASARKRMVPVFAPDMSQEDVHRLAWVSLAWRDDDQDAPVDVSAVVTDMRARQAHLTEAIGCTSAESFIEAVLGLSDVLDAKQSAEVAMRLDQCVRFWPSELLESHESLDRGSRLSGWDLGGFVLIADEAASAMRKQMEPDFQKLRETALRVKSA